MGVMVQLNKLHQADPEIRDDLQGRIEVFDQSIRSFEKRLRAVERRLSMEASSKLQAGRVFSGNFSGFFPGENARSLAASSSIFSQIPPVSPEPSVSGNSSFSDFVPPVSEGNVSSFESSAVLPSGEPSNLSTFSEENSSGMSEAEYKNRSINEAFLNLSESLHSLQAALSELSNLTHNNLKPEIEKLSMELYNLKAQQDAKSEYIKELESRIEVIENQNRLTLGSMKIPFEISGIAGSSALFLTGFLVWSGRWDVIKSPYFSTGLAILIAGAVLMKFYMANHRKKVLTERL
jgi:cell division protein FtsB